MKLLALGLTAAVAAGAALTTVTPASAGVYFEVNDGWGRYHRPPPPAYYGYGYRYEPRRVYYAPPPPPREVCRVRYVRDWGPYGPETRRVESCHDRW